MALQSYEESIQRLQQKLKLKSDQVYILQNEKNATYKELIVLREKYQELKRRSKSRQESKNRSGGVGSGSAAWNTRLEGVKQTDLSLSNIYGRELYPMRHDSEAGILAYEQTVSER